MSSNKLSHFLRIIVKSKYDHYGDGDGDMNAKDLDMHDFATVYLNLTDPSGL